MCPPSAGEIAPVANTPFDFLHKERAIGETIGSVSGGYDHNYVLQGPNALRAASAPPQKLSVAAWVHEPVSGRIMELLTDAPGLQFYTGAQSNPLLPRPPLHLSASVCAPGGAASSC